jgi:hypothetical protein
MSQRIDDSKQKDEDDWNLEDVTTSQRIANDAAEYDDEEEMKEGTSKRENGPTNEKEVSSEQVANWIVE